MYAVEIFCGSKFGGWRRTSERHIDQFAAATAFARQIAEERKRDITPLARRAVPV